MRERFDFKLTKRIAFFVAVCAGAPCVCGVALIGCSTPPDSIESSDITYTEFSLQDIFKKTDGRELGCRKMLDTYCSTLHSPEAQGNIAVGGGTTASLVLQGRTWNDFSNAFYSYSKAKIRAKDDLPADFQLALENQGYFPKLSQLLGRVSRSQMGLDARVISSRKELDIDRMWTSAIQETVLRRMDKKFPGYHKLREEWVPVEQAIERGKIRSKLISEISRSIWKKDRKWAKVESSFELLRKHFLSVIRELDIPEEIRKKWLSRVETVKLVIPGANPAIADSECSTTQSNAFYYSHLNWITVCAGDFNSEDIMQTIAHELGHALDLSRSRYLFQRGSRIGLSIDRLRKSVCSRESFDCSQWESFRKQFTSRVDDLYDYSPELPKFQRCLKRRPTKKSLSGSDIRRLAEKEVNNSISDLASYDAFLRITKERLPLPNGKTTKNPNYLNPCSYRPWSEGEESIDDDINKLLFFAAEYRCGSSPPEDKLKDAINLTRTLSIELMEAVISMEGEFSDRNTLDAEGFASTPDERFADVIGSYAFASYLSEMKDLWNRRHAFLASTSWQCDRPSLSTLYPEESRVQQGFVFDSHSATEDRKKEVFTLPMRKAVGCAMDFEFPACELSFKINKSDKFN